MAQHDYPVVGIKITGGAMAANLVIRVTSTILALKQQIQKSLGVEVPRQTLYFNDQELQDDHLVSDYDFLATNQVNQVNLTVAPYPGNEKFPVQVTSPLNHVEFFRVRETMLVRELKEKVERRFGCEKCQLFRFGFAMNDQLPLSAFHVTRFSEIQATIGT